MGQGMMGKTMPAGMMGSNMMGNTTTWNTGVAGPVNTEKAKELVNNYITNTGLNGISLAEIMEFETQFYAELKEDQTGLYAEELIVDKQAMMGTIMQIVMSILNRR